MNVKKPVLVRMPIDLYEQLVKKSAMKTIHQRRVVTVPGLIVETLTEAMSKPGKESVDG